ncbi:unnamed protein product, partial [Ascophyllum nodosum]
ALGAGDVARQRAARRQAPLLPPHGKRLQQLRSLRLDHRRVSRLQQLLLLGLLMWQNPNPILYCTVL